MDSGHNGSDHDGSDRDADSESEWGVSSYPELLSNNAPSSVKLLSLPLRASKKEYK